jgi:hypothetical protein
LEPAPLRIHSTSLLDTPVTQAADALVGANNANPANKTAKLAIRLNFTLNRETDLIPCPPLAQPFKSDKNQGCYDSTAFNTRSIIPE